jgi:hypothetical protein
MTTDAVADPLVNRNRDQIRRANHWTAQQRYVSHNAVGYVPVVRYPGLFAPNADRFSVSRNIQTLLVGVNYRF